MASKEEIRDAILRVRGNMRITKVVATRAVKTKHGDFFAGMSAAWESVQDDAGGMGSDLDPMGVEGDVAHSGMSLQDARVAGALLALEADTAAWRAALQGGSVSEQEFELRVAKSRQRTSEQVSSILDKKPSR